MTAAAPGPHDAALLIPHPARLDPERPDYAAIIAAHTAAVRAGADWYTDPSTGLMVMSAAHLAERGHCCEQQCRHCPYLARPA